MDEHILKNNNVTVSGVPLKFKGTMMTEGTPQIMDCEILDVVAVDDGMIRQDSIFNPKTTPMFLMRVSFKKDHLDIVTDMECYSPVFYESKHGTAKEFALETNRAMSVALNWADQQRINSMIELFITDQMHLMEDKRGDDSNSP
jgi:hypothetical protein